MHLASRHKSYRQIRKGSDAEAPAPLDLPRIYVEAYIRKAREDTFKRNCGLRPRQLESEAEMYAGSKGEVGVRVAPNVETVRVLELGGIAVRRRQQSRKHVSSAELLPLPDHVADGEARLRHLNGRDVA
jgi:hypothetical protein